MVNSINPDAKPREVIGELDIEDANLDNLQKFLLEFGHGYGRQQRQCSVGPRDYFRQARDYHSVQPIRLVTENYL